MLESVDEPEEPSIAVEDFPVPPPETPASYGIFESGWVPRHSYSVADEDTDLVLKSSDDDNFHVNSIVLKLSSSVFRDMLAMPRPQDSADAKDADPISLSESADVLRILLDIIYPGRGLSEDMDGPFGRALLPRLKSVGLAAIKYDMVTALRAIRTFLVSKLSIESYNAVELYGIAWDLGFLEEAKTLSTETLRCNLNAIETQVYLQHMSNTAVRKIVQLQQKRKIILLNALSRVGGDEPYYADAERKYGVLGEENNIPTSFQVPWQLFAQHRSQAWKENYEWGLLKSEASRIMEESPDGSVFFHHEGDFFYAERFKALSAIANMHMLNKQFRQIFDGMPKEIDV